MEKIGLALLIFLLSWGGIGCAEDQPKLVMIGDSLVEHGDWNKLLDQRVVNLGVSGDDSKGVLKRIETAVEAKPYICIVMIGTNEDKNDILFRNLFKIKTILEGHGIKVIFNTIPLVTKSYAHSVERNLERKTFNYRMRTSGLDLIDVSPLMETNGARPDDLAKPDGLHLTDKAYAIWAEAILKKLREEGPPANPAKADI